MKIPLLIIAFSLCFVCEAQNYSKGDLNKYTGTWQWSNGSDSFTIVLVEDTIKVPISLSKDTTLSLLYGWHSLVIDGKLSQGTIQFSDIKKNRKNSIVASIKNSNLEISFLDVDRNKHMTASMKFSDCSYTTAEWMSNDAEGVNLLHSPPNSRILKQTGLATIYETKPNKIPTSIILKKIASY